MSDFTNGAHECFCDRKYKDANKLASCGDCPRDYIAGAWDARRKYIEHLKKTDHQRRVAGAGEMSTEAKQTPLIELLELVPQDAMLVVEHDQFSSSSHPVGRLCHEAAAALRAARKVVAWARLVYARPVNAPASAEDWDELVDVEFHNRPEKPEGEGWRPLVFADTGDEALLQYFVNI